jgi:hypothetical protein
LATGAPARDRTFSDDDSILFQVVDNSSEILFIGNHTEMIQIARCFFSITLPTLLSLDWKQIDDGVAVDAHGRKAGLASAEFVEAFAFKPITPV